MHPMSGLKFQVIVNFATEEEYVVAEFDALDEAVLYALIQYTESERQCCGVVVCRTTEDGRICEF
jgi:hypothetical protein